MEIELTWADGVAEAVIRGDVDGRTAPEVQAKLLPLLEGNRKLLLDMSGVGFLSSAGLRMLLLLYRHFAARSGTIVLIGVSEEIQDTMSMTGFSSFFKLVRTRAEAAGV